MMGWEVGWKIGLLISSFWKQHRDLSALSSHRVLSFIQKQCTSQCTPTQRRSSGPVRAQVTQCKKSGIPDWVNGNTLGATSFLPSSLHRHAPRAVGSHEMVPMYFLPVRLSWKEKQFYSPNIIFFFFWTISMLPALQFCKLILWMLTHTQSQYHAHENKPTKQTAWVTAGRKGGSGRGVKIQPERSICLSWCIKSTGENPINEI